PSLWSNLIPGPHAKKEPTWTGWLLNVGAGVQQTLPELYTSWAVSLFRMQHMSIPTQPAARLEMWWTCTFKVLMGNRLSRFVFKSKQFVRFIFIELGVHT
ncbi:MAG: hypothetical protein KC519_04950, partial [Anaerolineae bacterium]|nr:hypothetical protein [Anaerolineae bacterium]